MDNILTFVDKRICYLNSQVKSLDKTLEKYGKGTVFIRKKKNVSYAYVNIRVKNKVKTFYLGKTDDPVTQKSIKLYRTMAEATKAKNENKKEIELLKKIKEKTNSLNIIDQKVLTIKEIKEKTYDIFLKYKLTDVLLFGSYARGEANSTSDVDFICKRAEPSYDYNKVINELETALKKHVDLIFFTDSMDTDFYQTIMKDSIKLFCDK